MSNKTATNDLSFELRELGHSARKATRQLEKLEVSYDWNNPGKRRLKLVKIWGIDPKTGDLVVLRYRAVPESV